MRPKTPALQEVQLCFGNVDARAGEVGNAAERVCQGETALAFIQASQLVEEESIVRRARVESDELRESARQETAELHKNTLDYMDSLLAETDRKLSELINNIRLERNEIRNHR